MKRILANKLILEVKLLNKVKAVLNNEKGFGLIETIIVAAIVILGIIAVRPEIGAVFTDSATAFRTWVLNRLTQLFS